MYITSGIKGTPGRVAKTVSKPKVLRLERWTFENMRQNNNNHKCCISPIRGKDVTLFSPIKMVKAWQPGMQYETKVWTLGRGVTCNDRFLVMS